MNIEQAKAIDMVDFLSKLGFEGKRRGKNVWYKSPLNPDDTPSFKVNTNLNLWYDWSGGEKRHGNIIEFGKLYFHCDVSGVLNELDKLYRGLPIKQADKPTPAQRKKDDEPEIRIISVQSLRSFPLLQYLKERRIPQSIADQYCKEITYQLHSKQYYAIGFKNDLGGYALRNRHIKLASIPNGFTFIDNGSKDVALFEGFFDFLSYKAMLYNQPEPQRNYLVYNSTSFFENALSILQAHNRVYSYGQNDPAGNKITDRAKEILKDKFFDERSLYSNHKDLNKFLIEFGHARKHKLRL
jgi:hypothetical protein